MNADTNAWSRKVAIGLIICAVIGTEVSYHFTLESRFEAIEEKLQTQTVVMQQMQDSLNANESSKNETLSGLNKQLASLQSSFEPLGKTTQAQADALGELHQQLSILQHSESDQQDAQRSISANIAQLESSVRKARAEAAAASVTKPATNAPASTVLPGSAPNATTSVAPFVPISVPLPPSTNAAADLMNSPGAISHPTDHASSESIAAESAPAPLMPKAQAVTELRPADVASGSVSPRAQPVGALLSSKR